jgi:DNA polymerase-3 subunit beta
MYLSIPSSVFADLLRRAKLAMDGKPRLPILGSIRFTVSPCGRNLEVASTDLDLTLFQQFLLDDPSTPGSVCLDFKQLAAIKPDRKTPVRISFAPHSKRFSSNTPDAVCLYVSAGMSARAELDSFPTSEFPAPPPIPSTDHLCLLPAKSLQVIAASIPFQSKDDSRYVLNGALLDPEMGGTVVATDGRRLFHVPAKVTPEPAIVPSKACIAIARLGPVAAAAAIHSDHTKVRFLSVRTPEWQIVTKLIDGNFPNYRQVIPHPESLTSSVTFSDPDGVAKWLRSLPSSDALSLTPRLPHFIDLSQGKSRRLTTTALLRGNPPPIAFNPHFLADAIEAVPGTLHLSDSMSPGVLRNPTALVVLMPMRITTETKTEAAA